jgi:hypothetical protein
MYWQRMGLKYIRLLKTINNMSRKPISNSYYQGKVIKTAEELSQLAKERKSVYHKNWGIKPAAVIINLPLHSIMESIEQRMFYNIIK